MSKHRTIIATVTESACRMGTSKYGNPIYRITTDKGSWSTETDAAVGYVATNYRPGAQVKVALVEKRVHTYVVDINPA